MQTEGSVSVTVAIYYIVQAPNVVGWQAPCVSPQDTSFSTILTHGFVPSALHVWSAGRKDMDHGRC